MRRPSASRALVRAWSTSARRGPRWGSSMVVTRRPSTVLAFIEKASSSSSFSCGRTLVRICRGTGLSS